MTPLQMQYLLSAPKLPALVPQKLIVLLFLFLENKAKKQETHPKESNIEEIQSSWSLWMKKFWKKKMRKVVFFCTHNNLVSDLLQEDEKFRICPIFILAEISEI